MIITTRAAASSLAERYVTEKGTRAEDIRTIQRELQPYFFAEYAYYGPRGNPETNGYLRGIALDRSIIPLEFWQRYIDPEKCHLVAGLRPYLGLESRYPDPHPAHDPYVDGIQVDRMPKRGHSGPRDRYVWEMIHILAFENAKPEPIEYYNTTWYYVTKPNEPGLADAIASAIEAWEKAIAQIA
jgi:hypothetical protein